MSDSRQIAITHLQGLVDLRCEHLRDIETGGDHPPVELGAEIQAFQREIAYLQGVTHNHRIEALGQ